LSDRDAAFGLKTSMGLGAYLGVMGSRWDVITAVWRTGLGGEWYKVSMSCFASRGISVPYPVYMCLIQIWLPSFFQGIRCLRQICAFAQPGGPNPANEREAWWISRWTDACLMCGGSWVRVVWLLPSVSPWHLHHADSSLLVSSLLSQCWTSIVGSLGGQTPAPFFTCRDHRFKADTQAYLWRLCKNVVVLGERYRAFIMCINVSQCWKRAVRWAMHLRVLPMLDFVDGLMVISPDP
jgi:hypothetical protein